MLRYSFGLEYVETRPATDEEKAHVQALAIAATKYCNRLRIALLVCGVVFLIGLGLIFSFGIAIVFIDLFVMGRLVLEYRDAKKPLPLLRASVDLEDLAVYGDSSNKQSTALHPTTGLLVRHGGNLVNAAIRVEGATWVKPESFPEAGWYPVEREHDRGLDRRPLTSAEIEELNTLPLPRHIRLNGWLLVIGWLNLGGLIAGFDPKQGMPLSVVWLCAWGLVIVIAIHVHWNIPVFRFWRDRRAKLVARAEVDGQRIEFFPHSRLKWTENGDPAPVRRGEALMIYFVAPSRKRFFKKQ